MSYTFVKYFFPHNAFIVTFTFCSAKLNKQTNMRKENKINKFHSRHIYIHTRQIQKIQLTTRLTVYKKSTKNKYSLKKPLFVLFNLNNFQLIDDFLFAVIFCFSFFFLIFITFVQLRTTVKTRKIKNYLSHIFFIILFIK